MTWKEVSGVMCDRKMPVEFCGVAKGENVWYYPPPTESGRLQEIPENVPGDIGRVPPPQTKILATPLMELEYIVFNTIIRPAMTCNYTVLNIGP